jgi:hypothetical protein
MMGTGASRTGPASPEPLSHQDVELLRLPAQGLL